MIFDEKKINFKVKIPKTGEQILIFDRKFIHDLAEQGN
jgi:hypothetical protein